MRADKSNVHQDGVVIASGTSVVSEFLLTVRRAPVTGSPRLHGAHWVLGELESPPGLLFCIFPASRLSA